MSSPIPTAATAEYGALVLATLSPGYTSACSISNATYHGDVYDTAKRDAHVKAIREAMDKDELRAWQVITHDHAGRATLLAVSEKPKTSEVFGVMIYPYAFKRDSSYTQAAKFMAKNLEAEAKKLGKLSIKLGIETIRTPEMNGAGLLIAREFCRKNFLVEDIKHIETFNPAHPRTQLLLSRLSALD